MDQADRPGQQERGRPTLALLVGLACWGADAASARAREWSRFAAAPAGPPPDGRRPRVRGLVIGLSMEMARGLHLLRTRGVAAAGPYTRALSRLAGPAVRIPGVQSIFRGFEGLQRRAGQALARIAAEGEREAVRCQEVARIGFTEVLDNAVARVARASEVREVLVDQSQGLVDQALLEVRGRAEAADEALEDKLRSLLHLPRRRPGTDTRDPAGRR
jgi:hypothetical protein